MAGVSAAGFWEDWLPTTAAGAVPDYAASIQPIFNRRCIACHGCLGSPCNVKLDSFRGVDRGGFSLNPYAIHFGDYPRTDMDAADGTQAWRQRGFYPILARDGAAEKENLDASLLYQMDRSVLGNSAYLKAFAETKARLAPAGWSLDAIWDGNGADPGDRGNAWLTVLRHETNVSVLKGAQGGLPRTLWLLSYAGFERMYYDTVASFAYWKGDTQKLETLLFFNFLRQGFEDHFLLMLPASHRETIRHRWTSVTVLRLNHRGKRRVYSLVANRVYASQWTLVFQNGQARPEEDTLSVYPTLINGFPNLFVDLDLDRAPDFLRDLSAVATDGAWRRFQDQYAIARNSDRFWPFYDWLNDWNFETRGADAGWLDLSYYDAPEL